MEPITLCGAVIVMFGLWVEFESVIMKAARAISKCSALWAIMPSTKGQRSNVFILPGDFRDYRGGSGLSYRIARN
jgi:hypothetical protein